MKNYPRDSASTKASDISQEWARARVLYVFLLVNGTAVVYAFSHMGPQFSGYAQVFSGRQTSNDFECEREWYFNHAHVLKRADGFMSASMGGRRIPGVEVDRVVGLFKTTDVAAFEGNNSIFKNKLHSGGAK